MDIKKKNAKRNEELNNIVNNKNNLGKINDVLIRSS